MVILTALNNLRCSVRPELIASVEGGATTTVLLTTGVSLEVREPADCVRQLVERARDAHAKNGHGRR